MRRQRGRWPRWVLPLLVAALAVVLVEGACNLRRLQLPQWQRGETALALDSLAQDGTDASAVALGAEEIVIPWSGYVYQFRLEGSALENVPYTLRCTLADGSRRTLSSVFALSLLADYILVDASVTEMTLSAELDGLTLTGLTVDNAPRWNAVRMLFTGLAVLAAGLLLALRHTIARRAEVGFLIVALACGLFLALGLPAITGLCYDDQIHFSEVWALSWGRMPRQSVTSENLYYMTLNTPMGDNAVCPQDTLGDYALLAAVMDAPENVALTDAPDNAREQWELTDTGYLAQAAGMALARALGLPMTGQVMGARLGGMLAYVLLCYLALRQLKRFKLVFAGVALFPMAMYLAGNFSYDPTCMGLCFLGVALMVDAMGDRATPLTGRRLLGIYVSILLACTVKAVYAPLLLLMLLMPREKFATRRERVYVCLVSLVMLLVAVGGILLDISQDISAIEDSRGEGADSAAQLAFILSHPLTYLGAFLRTVLQDFSFYFVDEPRTNWGYLGQCSSLMGAVSLGLFLFACITDHDPRAGRRISGGQRVGVLLTFGVTTGLVFTAMYVGFTAVGAATFSGVQGRYLLPALPLLYLLLSAEGVRNEMDRAVWHPVFFLGNLLVLMATCGQTLEQLLQVFR